MSVRAMPEWLTRRDEAPSPWNVTVGAAARGEAWTNRMERMMRVPDGDDALARVIRAHEMMHAKVSPLLLDPSSFGVSEEALRAAEEYRVNLLIGEAGFDLTQLADGSEKQSGKRLAEVGDWNNLVTFMAATAGTKSASELIAGVRSANPEMAVSLKEVEKAIINKWHEVCGRKRGISAADRKRAAAEIGSTLFVGGWPYGFTRFTVPLARMLETYMRRDDDGDEDAETGIPENFPKAEQIKKDRTGKDKMLKFRPVIVGDLPLTKRINGSLGRKRVASAMGRNPRRMHRMLVDPQRRVFDTVRRGNGGVVLVDLSGSMRLENDDILAMLAAAPGSIVIGYGVQRNEDIPNLWVLAEGGKVCEDLPTLGMTNGNDAPAIRFAAAKRRKSDPFIWVTDGSVHNGGYLTAQPEFSTNLYQECAALIVKHGIHQVLTVTQAVDALKDQTNGIKMLMTSTYLRRHAPRG